MEGRSFRTFVDLAFWPETEVRRFLKARSGCFSFNHPEELSDLGCEYKVMYEDE